jgi:hypothetical protein
MERIIVPGVEQVPVPAALSLEDTETRYFCTEPELAARVSVVRVPVPEIIVAVYVVLYISCGVDANGA